MIGQFIKKEFLETIWGPKFLITFAICAVLILTSVFTGYEMFRTEQTWYARAKAENVKSLANAGGYEELKRRGTKTLREPSRMSIFIKGVDSSIGKAAMVGSDPNIVLRDSRFGLNPIFAVFGELDLAFIVKLIMALFALLFSYNAVSGERELGTLKQVMSYPVSRASYIIGKSIGGILSLWLILIIPLLMALLGLLFIFNVNFTGGEWARIAMMTLSFCLYLAVFYMIGMFMSSLTRNSFVSFLLALFIWVVSIVIIPRASVEIAGQISPAPSIDVLESQRAALNLQYMSDLKEYTERYFKEGYDGNPVNFGTAFRDALDKGRDDAQKRRDEREAPIMQEYRRQQLRLLDTAQALSRISPSSALTLAVNRLANTDAELRDRFIESLEQFRGQYVAYVDERQKQDPGKEGGININMNNGVVSMRVPDYVLELPQFPEFSMDKEPVAVSIDATLTDLGVLTGYFVLLFMCAFVAFMRYDVR